MRLGLLCACIVFAGCLAPADGQGPSPPVPADTIGPAAGLDSAPVPAAPLVVEKRVACLVAGSDGSDSFAAQCDAPLRFDVPEGAGVVLQMTWTGPRLEASTWQAVTQASTGERPPSYHKIGDSPVRLTLPPGDIEPGTYDAIYDAVEPGPLLGQEVLLQVAVFEEGYDGSFSFGS